MPYSQRFINSLDTNIIYYIEDDFLIMNLKGKSSYVLSSLLFEIEYLSVRGTIHLHKNVVIITPPCVTDDLVRTNKSDSHDLWMVHRWLFRVSFMYILLLSSVNPPK